MSSVSIHSTAVVDPGAELGAGVVIEPYAIIGPHVKIGDNTLIRSHAVLEYAELGKDCVVYPHACLGLAPQHLKYKGERTKLVVGDRVTFRESVTVHRGTALDKSITTIGNDCYFMALSHIAHDCQIGSNVIFANAAQLAGHVQVGDYAFISSTAGIHQFVRIGSVAMISGGAMVPMDVAPFCIAQGDRAVLRGINLVGLRRMGADRESIRLIRDAFKNMFVYGYSLELALQQPALNVDNKFVKMFRQFFMEPKRGFVRPPAKGDQVEEEVTM